MPPHVAATARASGCGKARRVGEPRDDVVETDAREDRDAVPLHLAVERDGIAATHQLAAEQLLERVVTELRLLQADDVRRALVEPRQQTRHALLDGVDVPGRDPHHRYGSGRVARCTRGAQGGLPAAGP